MPLDNLWSVIYELALMLRLMLLLCLKTGNAAILRGGKKLITLTDVVAVIQQALENVVFSRLFRH